MRIGCKALGCALVFLTVVTGTDADRIFLKSGEVLEGKIKERQYVRPHNWCYGENDVVVWSNGTSRCVGGDDIVRVERQLWKPEGVALLAREDRWGGPGHGYRTQLIPTSDEFVMGKPMKFSLVMQNVTTNVVWYDHQGIDLEPLLLRDEDGGEPYYKRGCAQTGGSIHPIDEGEVVALFEGRDISQDYVILKAGEYTMQFLETPCASSEHNFPSSNVLRFEVKPARPLAEDLLITFLVPALPDECWVVSAVGSEDEVTPAGRTSSKGVLVMLTRSAALIRDLVPVPVWKTEKACSLVPQPTTETPTQMRWSLSEFLGKDETGYYYASISEAAGKLWPSIRADLAKALKLQTPQ